MRIRPSAKTPSGENGRCRPRPPAAVQLATVVGGVDEKLNKIWEITKAGRKKERERERERLSLASPPKSVGPRCVRWSVGRGRSVGHAIHTHSEVCAPCARNKFLLRPNIKNGRGREGGREGTLKKEGGEGGGGRKNGKVVHIKTNLTFRSPK